MSIIETKTASLSKVAVLAMVGATLIVVAFFLLSGFFGSAMNAQPPFSIGDVQ
jgi:hypothetical protein